MSIRIRTRGTVIPPLYEQAVDCFDRLQVDYGCKRQRLEKLINQLKKNGKSEAEIYGKIISTHRWFTRNRTKKRGDARAILTYYDERIFTDLKLFQERKGIYAKWAHHPFYLFLVEEKGLAPSYAQSVACQAQRLTELDPREDIRQTQIYMDARSCSVRSLIRTAFELYHEFNKQGERSR